MGVQDGSLGAVLHVVSFIFIYDLADFSLCRIWLSCVQILGELMETGLFGLTHCS